jgi:hypothetical protein
MYDFIIIGGGIAGLYSAYQIKKRYPKINLCILEKEERIGGRMGSEDFHGVSIAMGAGVGREKDVLLIQLLKELKISYKKYEYHRQDLNPHPVPVMETIRHLRSEYRKNPSEASEKTFRQYATQKLGKKTYDSFLISAGYTDYENEDVYETLYHYGMEDNEPGWKLLSIPWNDLLESLVQKIGKKNIHTNTEIIDLKSKSGNYALISKNKKIWTTSNVIMATKICVVQDLVPGGKHPDSLYQQIHAQPFLRVYAKGSDKSIPILKQYIPMTTLVPGPIHKIIPISPDKGIYMIVYTDNQGALELKKYIENTPENRQKWSRKIEECFGLEQGAIDFTDSKSYYWSCGTHYYSPLKKTEGIKNRSEFIQRAQRPCEGLWVVGEMISTNQGWVEGALESVQTVL